MSAIRPLRTAVIALFWVCLLPLAALAATDGQGAGADPGFAPWPRTVEAKGIQATIYQPQVDGWDGVRLSAHAALAAVFPGMKEPVYGVLALSADTLVDKESRSVKVDKVRRLSVSFPSAPHREREFLALTRASLLRGMEHMSLDRLEAALAFSRAEHRGMAAPLDNTPPRIIVSEKAALLIHIDGEPRFARVPGTALERVLNTRVLLLRDSGGAYYLHFLDGYLKADSLAGPWFVATPPAGATAAEKEAEDGKQTDLLQGQADAKSGKKPGLAALPEAPAVYVAQAPAELLVTRGQPDYSLINGTELLYVTNTTANIFKDMRDNKTYVLLAGRWFSAPSLEGPWRYVPPKTLPPDFARIPDDSPKENVKASVPGTPQAREAVLSASIPQTAVVDRNKTHFTPVIDGSPVLRPIEGTSLSYVLNASDPIIRVNQRSWYALHSGVWFTATAVEGPWRVAVSVPPPIYSIPVTSPLHYVVYVKIYSVTGNTVVVGYTPGYYGAIVTPDGVVVYGTGYAYPYWVSDAYWYGAPVTYGSGACMAWTPWGGWAFGFGFGWAYYDDDWCYPPAPWWGPYYDSGSYYNDYGGVTAWGPNGWVGTTGNVYSTWGDTQVTRRGFEGYDDYTGNQFAGSYGKAYNSRTGAVAVGHRGAVENVYTGNYAYGGHVAGVDPTNKIAGQAGRVTVGNEDSGRSATFSHMDVTGPDGKHLDAGDVRGQGGAVGHISNNVYGARDGNVYHYNSDTHQWDQLNSGGAGQAARSRAAAPPGSPAGIPSGTLSRDRGAFAQPLDQERENMLNREREGRSLGEMRERSFQNHGAQFQHNFGGGGFSRGGFGGFHGGGFRGGGFRR